MKKIQKQVDDFVKQYKMGYWEPLEILARIVEETGELAREINHLYGPKKKKPEEDTKELADEIGDIIFTLCCLANSKNIDLDKAFQKVMDKYNKSIQHKNTRNY